jgi:hypothetical protein
MDNQDYQVQRKIYQGIVGLSNWQLTGRLENMIKYKPKNLNKQNTK